MKQAAGSIIIPGKIFTGTQWLQEHAICCEQGLIKAIVPAASIGSNEAVQYYPHLFAAPAFLDLQVYGAAGKLLAAFPDPSSLHLLSEHNRRSGTIYCLPTVATNTLEVVYACIDAVRSYQAEGGQGIGGLHIEGPWIHPDRRGAHIASLVHPPEPAEVDNLLNYGKDVIRMITLAPEMVDPALVNRIRDAGIIVSAGHSNATYNEAMQAFDKGVTTVTHLYNAMSPLQHRAPGLVGATLDHASVTASIIPDGYHVDFAAIRIAKKAMGERLFAITDAVTDTTTGYYPHTRSGDKYEAGGILSGSALTMQAALQNLVTHAIAPLEEALRMCSLYPARVMGLEKYYGMIDPGYSADFILLDKTLAVIPV